MAKIDLTLPAIVFLDGNDGKTDRLEGRTVLLHVRSASVIEILEQGKCSINHGVPTYEFEYMNRYGVVEHLIAVAHYIAGDADCDNIALNNKVLKDCAEFYMTYCDNEDKNIEEEAISKFN